MIFFGIPCHGGMVHTEYALCFLHMVDKLDELKIPFMWELVTNDAVIPRARTRLANRFMELCKDPNDLFVFIDCDISFHYKAVLRLVQSKLRVCAAIYPMKEYQWEDLIRTLTTPGKNLFQAIVETNKYVFNTRKQGTVDIMSNGFVEVLDVPTGFLCIQQNVFQELITKELVKSYPVGSQQPEWDFFPTFIDPESKRFLSEDYGFSRICQQADIKTFADVLTCLGHTGKMTYWGLLYDRIITHDPMLAQTVSKHMRKAAKERKPFELEKWVAKRK